MRIAYLHYLWGSDTALLHVEQLTRALGDLGHEVSVHALNLAPTEAGEGTPAGRRARSLLKRLARRWLHEPKELLWNLRYLPSEVAALRTADVALVRAEPLGASWIRAARKTGVPVVAEVNSPVLETVEYQPEYTHLPWIAGALERYRTKNANATITVSGPLADHLVKTTGVSPDRVTVIANGADAERFHPDVAPDREAAAFRRTLGSGSVVGFVGSFQYFHGPDLLADILGRVLEADQTTGVILVGDGPGRSGILEKLAVHRNRVFPTGRVDHARVPGLVAAMDVTLLAETAFYCCPLKVLEWAAAGRAVVAPRQESVAELLTDGEAAALFPPGDAAAAAQTVAALLTDPERSSKLGCAAAARIRDELTWSHTARRVARVLREVREDAAVGSAG